MNEEIERILKTAKTIAVVGISNRLGRPSLTVANYLKSQGYDIIPVNPIITEILGERCYPDLESFPANIDVVDIFRKPQDVMPVVESAIRKGVKAVWMQEGIVNEEAAQKAREAGLMVVMDRCMLKEHMKRKGEKDA
ncbi:MAG: CoA-binding protein [Nitrospirae bacterium]|nr:CoA-binding protein [Nitrospirota bacterium]